LIEYVCPVCGETIKVTGNNIHNHYLEDLSKKFEKEGYKIIQEGKMPKQIEGWLDSERINGWREPDILLLKDLNLAKVAEIIDLEGYRVAHDKAEKIKYYYNPPEIIVFQPVRFLDRYWLPENLPHYESIIGYKPTSCIEIQEHFTKIWRKEGLEVIFWNETNI